MDFTTIDKIYDYFGHYFVQILTIFHVVYFAAIFKIATFNIEYLNAFNIFIHIFICFVLILRFNPLRTKPQLKEYDTPIIFSSSLFLLLNMTLVEGIKQYMPNYLDHLKNLKKIV